MFLGIRVALIGSLVCAGLLSSAGFASEADEQTPSAAKANAPAAAEPSKLPQTATPEKPSPKKELSQAQVALRDRVRRTLAAIEQQPFNTRENTVADLTHYCLAFGCSSEVHEGSQAGQKINGITCLCWNLPCGGNELMTVHEGHLAPRIGFGYQDSPSQLAMMLAMSRVPSEYPARAGETVRTVADLIEQEKLSCRSGTDLSLKLIAMSYYVHDGSWKNSLGESWSVSRIVKEELGRSLVNTPGGAPVRLLALSFALEQRAKHEQPIDGEFLRARKYVDESFDFALRSQNSDGSWGRVANRDYPMALSATGQVLEWLVTGLPEQRLEEPQVALAIEYVDGLLSSSRYRWNVQSMSSREISAVMHAAHALVMYDQRVFAPADPAPETPPPAKEAKEAKTRPERMVKRQDLHSKPE